MPPLFEKLHFQNSRNFRIARIVKVVRMKTHAAGWLIIRGTLNEPTLGFHCLASHKNAHQARFASRPIYAKTNVDVEVFGASGVAVPSGVEPCKTTKED
jgi:hypothetical protein